MQELIAQKKQQRELRDQRSSENTILFFDHEDLGKFDRSLLTQNKFFSNQNFKKEVNAFIDMIEYSYDFTNYIKFSFLGFVGGLYLFRSVWLGFACGFSIIGIGIGVSRFFSIRTDKLIEDYKMEQNNFLESEKSTFISANLSTFNPIGYKVKLITPVLNESKDISSYGLSFSIMESPEDGLQEVKKTK